jgi:hypothetical protein
VFDFVAEPTFSLSCETGPGYQDVIPIFIHPRYAVDHKISQQALEPVVQAIKIVFAPV